MAREEQGEGRGHVVTPSGIYIETGVSPKSRPPPLCFSVPVRSSSRCLFFSVDHHLPPPLSLSLSVSLLVLRALHTRRISGGCPTLAFARPTWATSTRAALFVNHFGSRRTYRPKLKIPAGNGLRSPSTLPFPPRLRGQRAVHRMNLTFFSREEPRREPRYTDKRL